MGESGNLPPKACLGGHMPVSKVVSSAVIAIFLSGTGLFAQSLGSALPAEFPPASYKARQYVDSKGCVYIRAGVDGNVTWVPRVTRSRQPICGAQPTFAKAKPKAAPTTKVAAAPAPKPAPVKKAPVNKPVQVVRAKPKPAPVNAPIRTVASITTPPKVMKPSRVRVAPPAPKRAAPVQIAAPAAASACPQFGPSGRFMQGSGVRCGPQTDSPVSYGSSRSGQTRTGTVVATATVAPTTRVVPKHVYDNRIQAEKGVQIPKGYRQVWEDDRLNPKRAEQTMAGKAAMDLVWTQTVPRRLIDRRTGKDASRSNPNLVYPYTNLTTQQQQQAYKYIKSPRVSTKSQARVQTRAVVSTKSRPAAPVSGKKYVQVGTFGVPANAQRTAQRLQQSGLPVRMSRYTKGGKTYQIVLAGPFGSARDLNTALSTARRAGFRDAFAR